jgi:hypothetical protein
MSGDIWPPPALAPSAQVDSGHPARHRTHQIGDGEEGMRFTPGFCTTLWYNSLVSTKALICGLRTA